jgi:hypothetical protein
MDNRYKNNEKILNNSTIYKQYLQERNIKNLVQYSTFNFGNLKNIEDSGIDSVEHSVEPFDKLYSISQRYYGSPEYGWLICYTNRISNELEIKTGDVLTIYVPLESVLGLLRNV